MPITKYIKGNLLDHDGPIAHGVNCKGKMNSGVAKAIRDKYPHHYEDYLKHLKFLLSKNLLPQDYDDYVQTTYVASYKTPPFRWLEAIYGIYTQNNYGYDGKRYVNYMWIIKGLVNLYSNINLNTNGQKFVLGIPKIGAGLGGGDWNIIEQIINDATPDLEIWVYELE